MEQGVNNCKIELNEELSNITAEVVIRSFFGESLKN